jgi:hypothetical protein
MVKIFLDRVAIAWRQGYVSIFWPFATATSESLCKLFAKVSGQKRYTELHGGPTDFRFQLTALGWHCGGLSKVILSSIAGVAFQVALIFDCLLTIFLLPVTNCRRKNQ